MTTEKTDSPRARLARACFDDLPDPSEHGLKYPPQDAQPLRTLEEQQELDDEGFRTVLDFRLNELARQTAEPPTAERMTAALREALDATEAIFHASPDQQVSRDANPHWTEERAKRHAEMFKSLKPITEARVIDWERQDAITPAQRDGIAALFLPTMTLHQAAQVLRRFSDDKQTACLFVEQQNGVPSFRMIFEDPKNPVPPYLKVRP